jgi:hypothetical protein
VVEASDASVIPKADPTMTRYVPEHTSLTNLLATCMARGCSWLGHRDLAGQLDWALLNGATAQDLRDIRASWAEHIDHLRTVHCVNVVQEPIGFFRIVGAAQPPDTVLAAPPGGPALDDDDDGAGSDDVVAGRAGDGAQAIAEAPNVRFARTARALMALHEADELANPLHKDSVSMFIRQVSECRHWHNSARYRSEAAAAMIAEAAGVITTAAQYQAFCRRNLRHEHMVPNNVVYRLIVANPAPTVEWLVDLFSRYSKRATITRDEDAQLRPFDMPDRFYAHGDDWYENAFARYHEAWLFDQLRPLAPGASWFPVR